MFSRRILGPSLVGLTLALGLLVAPSTGAVTLAQEPSTVITKKCPKVELPKIGGGTVPVDADSYFITTFVEWEIYSGKKSRRAIKKIEKYAKKIKERRTRLLMLSVTEQMKDGSVSRADYRAVVNRLKNNYC